MKTLNSLCQDIESLIFKGDLKLCKELLDTNEDIDCLDELICTAARYGHIEIISELLERGASVNATECPGNSILSLASSYGNSTTVEFLLQKGADIQFKNKAGWTPLMQACLTGRSETVALLLKNGATANDKAENERNISALMLASDEGSVEIVKLLLEYGANPLSKDDVGLMAADYAEFAMQTFGMDNQRWLKILELLPGKTFETTPELILKVDLKDCPICKGVSDYENIKVSGWKADFRKYFFKVMNCLAKGKEIHESYKFYSVTEVYQCPRCNSLYKKYITQDFDNTYVDYELTVNRISRGMADYLIDQIEKNEL